MPRSRGPLERLVSRELDKAARHQLSGECLREVLEMAHRDARRAIRSLEAHAVLLQTAIDGGRR